MMLIEGAERVQPPYPRRLGDWHRVEVALFD